MSEGIKDVLALADAITARRATDERFADLLTEVSTALAEITEALTKKDDKAEARDEAREAELMGKAIAAALLAGLRQMPAPTIALPSTPAATTWKSLNVTLNRAPSGEMSGFSVKRQD
jgi:hypothetical protein